MRLIVSRRTGAVRVAITLLKYLLVMLSLTAGLLLVAHLALNNLPAFFALQDWLYHHREYLLAWRCLLYLTGYAGIVWLWRQHGQGEKAVLYRPALALTLLILLSEATLRSAPL